MTKVGSESTPPTCIDKKEGTHISYGLGHASGSGYRLRPGYALLFAPDSSAVSLGVTRLLACFFIRKRGRKPTKPYTPGQVGRLDRYVTNAFQPNSTVMSTDGTNKQIVRAIFDHISSLPPSCGLFGCIGHARPRPINCASPANQQWRSSVQVDNLAPTTTHTTPHTTH